MELERTLWLGLEIVPKCIIPRVIQLFGACETEEKKNVLCRVDETA
jgi:hypothetical protein